MEKDIQQRVSDILSHISDNSEAKEAYFKGDTLYKSGGVQLLSSGELFYEISVEDTFKDFKVSFDFNEKMGGECSCKSKNWCSHQVAALMQVEEIIQLPTTAGPTGEGKSYSRKGMVERVLKERMLKA